jgi:hypothetical protein
VLKPDRNGGGGWMDQCPPDGVLAGFMDFMKRLRAWWRKGKKDQQAPGRKAEFKTMKTASDNEAEISSQRGPLWKSLMRMG